MISHSDTELGLFASRTFEYGKILGATMAHWPTKTRPRSGKIDTYGESVMQVIVRTV